MILERENVGFIMKSSESEDTRAFTIASSVEELVEALKNKSKNLKGVYGGKTRYVYHYTKEEAVKDILKSKKWLLNSPFKMNDGLERLHIEEANVNNLFFSCFLTEYKESIAMWSMYSQPWEEGVLIRIPIKEMKKWVKGNPLIYEANADKQAVRKIKEATMILHHVVYTNAESMEDNEEETHYCGDEKNVRLTNIYDYKELAGYVKNIAWEYEKEIRLRVEVPVDEKCSVVLIDIPKEVLDSFEFITGPRYNKNLLAEIRKINREYRSFSNKRITESLFTGRLEWVYCDDCRKKKKEAE